MQLNVRKAVLENISNATKDEIYTIINDSLSRKEDITLPGLGVLFEVVWEKANPALKEQIVNLLQ